MKKIDWVSGENFALVNIETGNVFLGSDTKKSCEDALKTMTEAHPMFPKLKLVERLKNFYFTFGSNHITNDGKQMNNCWIRVVAENYTTARQIFIDKFSSVNMEKPDKWAFQYTEEDFQPKYFPEGEYLVIEQEQL